MKITMSKNQWETMGNKDGWIKKIAINEKQIVPLLEKTQMGLYTLAELLHQAWQQSKRPETEAWSKKVLQAHQILVDLDRYYHKGTNQQQQPSPTQPSPTQPLPQTPQK